MRGSYAKRQASIKRDKQKKLLDMFYIKQFSQMAGNDSDLLQKEIDSIVKKLEALLD